MKLRSIGPERNPLSMGPEPGKGPEERGIGPERTEGIEFRGIGCRGMEAKESELWKEEALSREEWRSVREVERGVEVLALREAPEIDLKAKAVAEVVERRGGSGWK